MRVDCLIISDEEARIADEYRNVVITDADIIAIFRRGVDRGRKKQEELSPHSVCYEH